jgi:hypothetical protein
MAWCCRARANIAGPRANRDAVECGIETLTNAERIELNALARKAQDELGRLHGPEVVLETLDGPTPYRAGDRVIIRETIRDAGLHNGSVAACRGSVLFVERRDGQTVPIDTRQFPGVQHGYAHTEYREQGSTRSRRAAPRRSARQPAQPRRRHDPPHARLRDVLLCRGGRIVREPRAVRRAVARQGFARRFRRSGSGGRAARGTEEGAAARGDRARAGSCGRTESRTREKRRHGIYIERELRDRGVRTISRDDILKIMPEVCKAASQIHYGSQTEIMAKIVQEKLAPKQSRGMRR